ncbi:MAG: STAS domain-containing protein [Sphaerochaetaceae bacterium]|nr:STAS domain-containing protein [Sphaerochaetaceae bacterium]
MTIEKKKNGEELTVSITGRLDTSTAPELEASVREELSGYKQLVLDFSNLEYLSSAGLRVILSFQKIMNAHGTMVVRNVNETIKEIFDITGFAEILTIE